MSHLLLVEDEDPVGANMLRELAELGGLVDRVRDGAAAIRKLSSGKYEGVVLDLKLGTTLGPQGLSVLDEMKRTHPDIAVVVVTAHPHLAVRALEIGVDALLYKPVEGSHVMQYLRRAVELRRLRRENAKLRERLELIPEAPGIVKSLQSHGPESRDFNTVFIVHGHDEAVRESVARFVSRLGLTPVVLHERPSQGRTVVEKLEAHGAVGFAIILLTPDDVGGSDPHRLQPRARQNVVLELGYFLGRLQRNRVCAIYRGDLEIPSDYMGVIYIPFDSAGAWRLELAKELKAAGLHVDMNKAI